MEELFVKKRWLNILIMDIATVALSVFIFVYKSSYIDEVIEFLALDLIFLFMFHYLLLSERLAGRIASDKENDLSAVSAAYTAMCVLTSLFIFLPEFSRPVLLISLIVSALSEPIIGITAGIYLSSVICLASAGSVEEVIMYVLMVVIGAIISDAMEQEVSRGGKLYLYILLIACLNISFAVIFSYFLYMEPSYIYAVYGLCSGIFTAAAAALVYKRLVRKKMTHVSDEINDILDEQYALARELKEFSKAEYQHARRVSAVASKCAEYVGVDAKLCAAAGMYYRIGILEGEPLSKTSRIVAKNACFPENVLQIINEYGGEEALPSNIESAIVHMVDGLLLKLEVLREQSTASKWNKDMIIYQTLNDFSAKGLYDKSGLSMNQFLKVREFLVNEEKLI